MSFTYNICTYECMNMEHEPLASRKFIRTVSLLHNSNPLFIETRSSTLETKSKGFFEKLQHVGRTFYIPFFRTVVSSSLPTHKLSHLSICSFSVFRFGSSKTSSKVPIVETSPLVNVLLASRPWVVFKALGRT